MMNSSSTPSIGSVLLLSSVRRVFPAIVYDAGDERTRGKHLDHMEISACHMFCFFDQIALRGCSINTRGCRSLAACVVDTVTDRKYINSDIQTKAIAEARVPLVRQNKTKKCCRAFADTLRRLHKSLQVQAVDRMIQVERLAWNTERGGESNGPDQYASAALK